MIPITASATAATMAPRVEIYTMLACRALQPDYSSDNGTLPGLYDVSDGGTLWLHMTFSYLSNEVPQIGSGCAPQTQPSRPPWRR